jgi:hypothetical protein
MSANDPRLEFRPGPEVRARLEALRKQVEAETGRPISMSKLVKEIIQVFFRMGRKSSYL